MTMAAKDFDVVVVGNTGIDTNVYLYSDEIDFSVEANFTRNVDYVGQAGGFVSRGFAQLGYKTSFIGFLGDDYQAGFVRDEFSHDGIDMSAVFIDPMGTARSVNFMYPDGRRKNFYDGKGHMEARPDLELCRKVLSQSKFVHFSIPNWARIILPVAKELGLTISCDIQDIVVGDDRYRKDFIDYADILFFSAVNFEDPSILVHNFIETEPERLVVVGMGEKGCALGVDHQIKFYPPVEMDTPVIDTNGAGDGLAVGFLAGYLLEGYSVEESILRGQIAARYTCGLKATSSNLISKLQLDAIFGMMKAEY